MNPSSSFDSQNALEGRPEIPLNLLMTRETSPIRIWILKRYDPPLNMARFYVVAIEPTLFGDTALLRQWGRIGTQGCERRDLYPSEDLAREALETWLRRKTARGYQLRERVG